MRSGSIAKLLMRSAAQSLRIPIVKIPARQLSQTKTYFSNAATQFDKPVKLWEPGKFGEPLLAQPGTEKASEQEKLFLDAVEEIAQRYKLDNQFEEFQNILARISERSDRIHIVLWHLLENKLLIESLLKCKDMPSVLELSIHFSNKEQERYITNIIQNEAKAAFLLKWIKEDIRKNRKKNAYFHSILVGEKIDKARELTEFADILGVSDIVRDLSLLLNICYAIEELQRRNIYSKAMEKFKVVTRFQKLVLDHYQIVHIAFDLIDKIKANSETQWLIYDYFINYPGLAKAFYNACPECEEGRVLTRKEFDKIARTTLDANPGVEKYTAQYDISRHFSVSENEKIKRLGKNFNRYETIVNQSKQRDALLAGLLRFHNTQWQDELTSEEFNCFDSLVDFFIKNNLIESVVISKNMLPICRLAAILMHQRMEQYIPAIVSDPHVWKLLKCITDDNMENEEQMKNATSEKNANCTHRIHLDGIVQLHIEFHKTLLANSNIAEEIFKLAYRVNPDIAQISEDQYGQIIAAVKTLHGIWHKVEKILTNKDVFYLVMNHPQGVKIAFDLIELIDVEEESCRVIFDYFKTDPHLAQNFFDDVNSYVKLRGKEEASRCFSTIVLGTIENYNDTQRKKNEMQQLHDVPSQANNWAVSFKGAKYYMRRASEQAGSVADACRERFGFRR